ncbi:hypothetical protein [Streptacidiphilus anmyonensis]|uniref:hypothetical protein n=1 Tax=Streptacidiphilus anmyonensis TaxID=405782 RepID=UPI0005AAE06F|nr:hypothetical protein [Streptacidiphilus anmyonensis]
MNLTTNALFVICAAGLAIWMWRDASFRKREFLAVSLFWILLVGTPWGADTVAWAHQFLTSSAHAATTAVNTATH